ncbi:hypothetical protein [Rhodococcus opacus]
MKAATTLEELSIPESRRRVWARISVGH